MGTKNKAMSDIDAQKEVIEEIADSLDVPVLYSCNDAGYFPNDERINKHLRSGLSDWIDANVPKHYDMEYIETNPDFDPRLELLYEIRTQLEDAIWSDIESLSEFISNRIADEMKTEGKVTDSDGPPPRYRTISDLVGRSISEEDFDPHFEITKEESNGNYKFTVRYEAFNFGAPQIWQCDRIEVYVTVDKSGCVIDIESTCQGSSFKDVWDVDIGPSQMDELTDLTERVLAFKE